MSINNCKTCVHTIYKKLINYVVVRIMIISVAH